jgi:hypothetical protein
VSIYFRNFNCLSSYPASEATSVHMQTMQIKNKHTNKNKHILTSCISLCWERTKQHRTQSCYFLFILLLIDCTCFGFALCWLFVVLLHARVICDRRYHIQTKCKLSTLIFIVKSNERAQLIMKTATQIKTFQLQLYKLHARQHKQTNKNFEISPILMQCTNQYNTEYYVHM